MSPTSKALPGPDRDLEEQLAQHQAFFERRSALDTVVNDFAELRDWNALTTTLTDSTRTTNSTIEFDGPKDVTWANPDTRFRHVLHAFHLEWHGIRAAAGYLPGHKLGFTSERELNGWEFRRVLEAVEQVGARDVIFHGFSNNALALVQLLRRAGPPGLRVHTLWHGNTSQFHYEFEVRQFMTLVDFLRDGKLDSLGTVKPGMELAFPQIYPKVLLNLGPALGRPAASEPGRGRSAFIPVPNDWRKNFYTNLYAASASGLFDRIVVTSNHEAAATRHLKTRVVRVQSPDRQQVFSLINKSRLVMNATLSECQPMIALEALALRVPCLTGVLGLEEFDEHPYGRLTQVSGVDSVHLLRDAIVRVCDEASRDPRGLGKQMDDYASRLELAATARLLDFIQ